MFYQNYSELTWEEIEGIDKTRAYLLLPLSSTEQHGKHLPLATDDIILQMCMDGLKNRENTTKAEFYCLPKLSYGRSPEHMNFPGTVSISTKTYFSLIHDIIESVAKHGFKYLITVNGHGGNTALLNGFSHELKLKSGIEIYNLELPQIYGSCNELTQLSELHPNTDIHAGDIETSLLLYNKPSLVHMEKARDEIRNIESWYNSWLTNLISDTGVLGEPTHANVEKGKLIYEYMIEKMEKILEKMVLRK